MTESQMDKARELFETIVSRRVEFKFRPGTALSLLATQRYGPVATYLQRYWRKARMLAYLDSLHSKPRPRTRASKINK